jgi:hypothetical protein
MNRISQLLLANSVLIDVEATSKNASSSGQAFYSKNVEESQGPRSSIPYSLGNDSARQASARE